LLEKYANRNQSERFKARDQAALNLASIMGTLGCTKRLPTFLQNPGNLSPELKGSYYVVNRVLYSYMYDYATSVYEKEKYAALTQKYRDSSLQHFPKQSRQHLIIQAELLIEKDKRTNHYNDYLLFSHYFSSDPDRAVFAYIISHAYHQRKTGKREKMVSHLCISDLKLAKRKYFTAESGFIIRRILTGLTNTYNALEDALFCNARLRTYEISNDAHYQ
jgi:hypothetical protein